MPRHNKEYERELLVQAIRDVTDRFKGRLRFNVAKRLASTQVKNSEYGLRPLPSIKDAQIIADLCKGNQAANPPIRMDVHGNAFLECPGDDGSAVSVPKGAKNAASVKVSSCCKSET